MFDESYVNWFVGSASPPQTQPLLPLFLIPVKHPVSLSLSLLLSVSLTPSIQLGGYQLDVRSGSVFKGIFAEENAYLMSKMQLCLSTSPIQPLFSPYFLLLFGVNVPSIPLHIAFSLYAETKGKTSCTCLCFTTNPLAAVRLAKCRRIRQA